MGASNSRVFRRGTVEHCRSPGPPAPRSWALLVSASAPPWQLRCLQPQVEADLLGQASADLQGEGSSSRGRRDGASGGSCRRGDCGDHERGAGASVLHPPTASSNRRATPVEKCRTSLPTPRSDCALLRPRARTASSGTAQTVNHLAARDNTVRRRVLRVVNQLPIRAMAEPLSGNECRKGKVPSRAACGRASNQKTARSLCRDARGSHRQRWSDAGAVVWLKGWCA